jgi:dTDP-4-amino-4,6-dideoxygalactose transaminase
MVSPETSEEIVSGSCFVNFPIAVQEGARDRIHRELIAANYDVGQSLYPNVHASPAYAMAAGRSQRVQQLVDRMLYLPTHFGVDESYARALADKVCSVAGRNAQ